MELSFCVWLICLIFAALTRCQNSEDPTSDENLLQFRSRPDLYPPRLFVNISENEVTPGYIFMAPYQSFQNSAAIYDSDGTLIWYGFGVTGSGNVHDFRLCSYNSTDHLCFFSGEQYLGYARGQATIMDTSLRTVRTVTAMNALSALDQHEFNVVGDSALTTIYTPRRFDMSAYNITSGEGWIQDSVFQDVNLTTGELSFEWSAIEHVALSESYVVPNQTEVAGTGFSAVSPWDYFHMNSVDKNQDGDYLISARHVNTLYKINGQSGEITWRCGGKLSDFEILNGLNWSSQHDARWIEYNSSTEIISFFDNASNGFSRSANHSAGYIIKIDHTASPPTVELLHSYPAPEDLPISDSQGNVQVFNPSDWSHSNVFAGWGSQPTVTEHTPDGTIIFRASVASDGKMNYRAYKFNVTLTPYDNPALYTYSQNAGADTTFYMSWNGATEVRRWRIYGRAGCENDWTLLNEVDKTGFETNFTTFGFQEFGMVEAVDANGTGLRNSTNRGISPFVPSVSLTSSCTGDGCNVATEYGVSSGQEVVAQTQPGCAALPVSVNSTVEQASQNSGTNLHSSLYSAISLASASSILIGLYL